MKKTSVTTMPSNNSLTSTVLFAIILTVTFLTLLISHAHASIEIGDRQTVVGQGCMTYPWGEGEVVFWQDGSCAGGGNGGIVNTATKISINGKNGTKRDLKYLSKKSVHFRLIKTGGRGEGSKTYAISVQILTDEDMP